MRDLPQVLMAIDRGERVATSELFPLVYEELRRIASSKMAQEGSGQTLQTTALVHEAYLRLIDSTDEPNWDGRSHFFGAAAEAMRRILVDTARRKDRQKRGGDWVRADLDKNEPQLSEPNVDILALNEALDQLAELDPNKAELVKLRYFAGMTIEDAASALGMSTATAVRQWRYSRAWLADKMELGDVV